MGIDDESPLFEGAEVQRGGGDLAAHAANLFQPDKRGVRIQTGQEFQINGTGAGADMQQGLLQLPRLLVGELDAFQRRLDFGHRRVRQGFRAAETA